MSRSNHLFDALKGALNQIESVLDYSFVDKSYLITAFVHSSFLHEHPRIGDEIGAQSQAGSNERLEFLGDSVLGLVMSDFLYRRYPELPEGRLSELKARLVASKACNIYLKQLDLGKFLLLGRGESKSLKSKHSLFSDLFEALLGALYLDGGVAPCRQLLCSSLKPVVLELLAGGDDNWKGQLQAICLERYRTSPSYHLLQVEGPEHLKTFHVEVRVEGTVLGRGVGRSKKEAQQAAARAGLAPLQPTDPQY